MIISVLSGTPKVALLIDKLSGTTTNFSALQPWNALLPIEVTLWGIVIDVRCEQPLNALSLI